MERMLGILFAIFCLHAHTQELNTEDKYLRRLKISESVTPHGDAPFGEKINLYTGDLTFSQADVALEGKGPTIRLVRDLASIQISEARLRPHAMGDWMLSIPRIETFINKPRGVTTPPPPGTQWAVGPPNDPQRLARCTRFSMPFYGGTLNEPESAWYGMEMVAEDGSRQQLLKRDSQYATAPFIRDASGNSVPFPGVTLQHWQIGCLPNTSNGEDGEAFLVIAPDGTRYFMDHLVGEGASPVYEQDQFGSGVLLQQHRMFAMMYASRVEDRFGNWVKYHFTGDRLTSISASDGRAVNLTWRQDAPVVGSITVMPGPEQRVWQYQYRIVNESSLENGTSAILTDVVLPDGRRWTFELGNILGGRAVSADGAHVCGLRTTPIGGPNRPGGSARIVHPSGVTGIFTVSPRWHARNYVPTYCVSLGSSAYEYLPVVFGTLSLTGRTMIGAGLPDGGLVWTYQYEAASGSAASDACAASNSCPVTKWVSVTSPEGDISRHFFSNRWGELEGRLLKTERFRGAGPILDSEEIEYAISTHGPWPGRIGSLLSEYKSNFIRQEVLVPELRRTIRRQGTVFKSQVNGFDAYARPVSVTKSSAPAF